MGKIIVLIGGSGSGKSTLDNHLRTLSSRVRPVTSITTRAKRETDAEGDYNHLTKEEFQELIDGQKLLWSSDYGGNNYGTSEESVLEVLNSAGKIGTMVLVPEVMNLFYSYLKNTDNLDKVSFYYVDVDDEDRKERLLDREGDLEVFMKRLDQDRKQKEDLFRSFKGDLVVLKNNGGLEEFLGNAVSKIKEKIPEIDKENKPGWELQVLKNARELSKSLERSRKLAK